MTVTYGLTPQGLITKPFDQIASEVDGDIKAILGDSAGTEPDGSLPPQSMAGQLKTLLVDSFAAFWDQLQAVYANWDPNQTTGAAQDAICAITGVTRDGQVFSTVTGTCTGVPGTVIPPQRSASVAVTGSRFDTPAVTPAPVTITSLGTWVALTPYIIGNRVTNGGNAYHCITAGTSAASGGPTTTNKDITDGTVHWAYLGPGTGAVDVLFTAEAPGPIGALPYTLTTIATPVDGWRGVNNLLAALPGSLIESDSALRVRRDAELAPSAEAAADAIRGKVLAVGQGTNNPVTACRVFFNDTDATDANGLLPHSIEVVVEGGPDDTIPAGLTTDPTASVAAALWHAVDAGTNMNGSTSVTVKDSQGYNQTVKFQRPTGVPIYISCTVAYDATKWPATGAAALVEAAATSAIMTYFSGWLPGISVRSQPIGGAVKFGPSQTDAAGAAVFPAAAGSSPAPGIVEVTSVFISTSPTPTLGTTIVITAFQLATFDPSRITITPTTEIP